jgi:hypothetical protein
MGKQKLTAKEVLEIKQALLDGALHKSLGEIYGVNRATITKINKSLTDPTHPNSRWGDTPLQ